MAVCRGPLGLSVVIYRGKMKNNMRFIQASGVGYILSLPFVLLLVTMSIVSTALASSPQEYVKGQVDGLRDFVRENKDKLQQKELDDELERRVLPLFDFEEMSKRSLGAQWNNATPEERTQYVELFSSLLASTYLAKIRDGLQSSDVKFDGERTQGKKAIVKTRVMIEDTEAAIDYRLNAEGDQWKVYDVVIENVGLVSNYRTEFSSIVRREGMSGLIARLKEKKADLVSK